MPDNNSLDVAASSPAATPAGWYPDSGSGRTRWWDGAKWTEQYAPPQAPVAASPAPVQVVTVVGAREKRVNHALHLILTILTAGLWLPVWIILAISNS